MTIFYSQTLISYNIYLKSQPTVIKAIYQLSSDVLGFALAVTVLGYC